MAFAKAVICGDGSEPIDKIQIRGPLGSDSSKVASKSRIHASPYSGPRESKMPYVLNSYDIQLFGISYPLYIFLPEIKFYQDTKIG